VTSNCSDILRISVGHILNKPVGFVRKVQVKGEGLSISSDLFLDILCGNISLTRTPPGILVVGDIEAIGSTECGRCLDDYLSTTRTSVSELYSLSSSEQSDFTIDESCMLDLTPLFRELLLVAEPILALCCSDCKGLCVDCGANLNNAKCDCRKEGVNEH
jgi:uncharacterized protein